MGRITIFSIEECKFCRRAKAALSARDIPYADINIETHPSKRADMISLADRITVPQIFVNDEHVGGSEEVLALLARWDAQIGDGDGDGDGDDDGTDKSPRERYIRLVESKPDPTDERLAIPELPGGNNDNGGNDDDDDVMKFNDSRVSEIFQIGDRDYAALDITKLLIQRMPRDSLTYLGYIYINVFKGSTGVTALQKIFHLESREEAVQLGVKLQCKQYMDHYLCKDRTFGDNDYYFQLQPFHTPKILNAFYVWSDPVGNDAPMHVIHSLGKLWSKLESRHLSEDGMVDHATIRDDELYWKFEIEVCELQAISLDDSDDATKTAFVINAYNLMIKYAFCKMGIPATSSNRSSFFDDVSINVGGGIFSFNDLEHGILRANTRHPYQLMKRFGSRDSRKRLSLEKLDCRVHFALNCGAKSCPPVKKYTAEAIEDQLELAAMAFCEGGNVVIDVDGCQLYLNKILQWYMADFAASKNDLPQKILQYVRGEKKETLNKLIQQGNVSVKFLEYDWSSDEINFATFEKSDLSEKVMFLSKSPRQKYDLVQEKL